MKEMKIVQCLIICCIMMSGAVLLIETPSAALDTEGADNRETHGSDFTTDGNMEIIILEDNQGTSPISWNNTTQVYDLQFPTAERLRVKANITGLELERNFDLEWQVYAYIGNRTTYGPIHHFSGGSDAFSGLIQFNTHTGSTAYLSPLFDDPDSGISINQHPANQAGCYWVMATISDKSPHISEVMTSNISKMVSYGALCPTNDLDGDGWTDAQELAFSSDQNDANSTPTTVLDNWISMYNSCSASNSENASAISFCQSQLTLCQEVSNGTNSTLTICQNDLANATGCSDCNCNSSGCPPDLDLDADGWSNQIEQACGSNPNNASSVPTDPDDSDLGVCWELQDDDDDGIPNKDDDCNDESDDGDISAVDSHGCSVSCPTCESNPQTGEGADQGGTIDVFDLIVVGGVGLLGGIGISSMLPQSGGGRLDDGGTKKPNVDLDDIGDAFDDIDIDLDADLDLDKPDVEKAEPRSRSGSDQYFKSGVERQKAMTDSGDSLLDDYVEDEVEGESN